MSRDRAAVLTELLATDPPGWVLPNDPASDWGRLMAAMAAGVAEVEAAAEALTLEVDPRAANLLLEDFERVLGPDPCGRYDLLTTLAERRLIAFQRWTARGGQSEAYFIALCAALGVTATIETDVTTQVGFECGDEIVVSPEQYVWRIDLPLIQEFDFETGEGVAGDFLGWLVPSLAECVIRRYAPAHTIPVISYS
jgi:uncharacterized protein YmfQ (DUF2313 family)